MYRIVWEYEARPESVEEFERVYGPHGRWAEFFGGSEAYLGMDLFRSTTKATRFITVDRWKSRVDYETFRRTYAGEYAALDEWCERLTLRERTLGMSDDGK
jgi:heme-degrading monooxygenase HmoA